MRTILTVEQIRERIQAEIPAMRAYLAALVQYQSVANQASTKPDLDKARDKTKNLLESVGFQGVQIIPIAQGAALYGEMQPPSPHAPTVLLYAHYDVVPAGHGWETEPFTLIERDGRYYGRGAADDKSGIVIHLTALKVLREALGVGVKVLIEGSEEAGDGSLEEYVREHPTQFQADTFVVADTGNWLLGKPTLTIALRGDVALTVTLRTLRHEVHSGEFGGPAPDALMALVQTLATLMDKQGNVTIDGLSSAPWEGSNPMSEEQFRKYAGILPGVALTGQRTLADRLWAGYAVSVIGIDAPTLKDARHVLIASASARISMRIPPAAIPAEALEKLKEHLRNHCPWNAEIEFSDEEQNEGYAGSMKPETYQDAVWAFKEAYGEATALVGTGGSIPLVNAFASVSKEAKLFLWGAQDPEAVIHAPNESVSAEELMKMSLTEALLLYKLGGGQ